jgi:hypothetical protein
VNGLLASRSEYRRREGWSLVDYLLSAADRDCTNPHDLVYAGLGLLKDPRVEVTRSKIGPIITYPNRYTFSLLDRPDYAADVRDTYFHCAIRLLQEENLGALSFAYDGRPDQPAGWFAVPSWVPHFSGSSSHSLLLADRDRTYAAGGRSQPRINVTHSELLQLASGAVLLDSIDQVFQSGVDAIDELLVRTLDASDAQYPHTNEHVFVALARTLMADCFRGQRLGPRCATARLMKCLSNRLEFASRRARYHERRRKNITNARKPWYFTTMRESDCYYRDMAEKRSQLVKIVEEYRKRNGSGDSAELDQEQSHEENSNRDRSNPIIDAPEKPERDETMSSAASQNHSILDAVAPSISGREAAELARYLSPVPDPYDVELEDVLQHHAFFTTKNGRFGIGSPHLLQGDTIIVPVGSAIPYIGRRLNSIKPTPRFKLVGEAYVHGIMDGELVDGDLWRPEVIAFR